MGLIKRAKFNIHDCVMDRLNALGASDDVCAHINLFGEDAVYMGVFEDKVIVGLAVAKNGTTTVQGKECCIVYDMAISKSILKSKMSHDLLDLIETIRVNARNYGDMTGHTFDVLSDVFNADAALCLVPRETNLFRAKSGNILALDIVPIYHSESAQLMDKDENERKKCLEKSGISELDRRVFGIDYSDELYNIDTESEFYKETVLVLEEAKKEFGEDFNGYIDLSDQETLNKIINIRERLFGKGA